MKGVENNFILPELNLNKKPTFDPVSVKVESRSQKYAFLTAEKVTSE